MKCMNHSPRCKGEDIDDFTEDLMLNMDFLVTGLVERKWYDPRRYLGSKYDPHKAIGKFISKQ